LHSLILLSFPTRRSSDLDSGVMYFGSVKGMISFKPEAFSKNAFIPPVYITGFQVFNSELAIAQKGSPLQKSISYTDKISLNYDQDRKSTRLNSSHSQISY